MSMRVFLPLWFFGNILRNESEVAQSCLTLCDLWTVAHQAPPSVGFSRQEYRSGLPCPSSRHLPDPGTEPVSPETPALKVESLLLSHQEGLIILYHKGKNRSGIELSGTVLYHLFNGFYNLASKFVL